VQQLVVQLLAIIQQQTKRIQALEARVADLEARLQQRSHNSDRPPSSDPPYEKRRHCQVNYRAKKYLPPWGYFVQF